MTATNVRTVAWLPPAASRFRLPDPSEQRQDEKMTSAKHLGLTGNAHYLAVHLGNPDTTVVGAELYIVPGPARNMAGSRYPDLLVSFNADPEAYYRSNGYIISEQGKPPDFVLEIASPSTGHIDVAEKRDDYAALGIAEYWRFDETGEHHGARLAGDRLENGEYVPVSVTEIAAEILQGHSAVLDIDFRWERGRLGLYIPASGRHIATIAGERARADREQAARIRAETQAEAERNRAEAERRRAERAEARIRELEATLRQLRNP